MFEICHRTVDQALQSRNEAGFEGSAAPSASTEIEPKGLERLKAVRHAQELQFSSQAFAST